MKRRALEAAEGLVEIREDYVEDNSNEGKSKPGPLKQDLPSFSEADKGKAATDDEEYALMMVRLDELEMEELVAKSSNGSDENEKIDETYYQRPIDDSHQNSEVLLFIYFLNTEFWLRNLVTEAVMACYLNSLIAQIGLATKYTTGAEKE